MKKLEYRLNDKWNHFPAIFHYEQIQEEELICRMSCGYYVKENKVYKAISNALEPNGMVVIYVEEAGASVKNNEEKVYSGIGFEIRELNGNEARLIKAEEHDMHRDVQLSLHSDFLYIPRKGSTIVALEFKLDSLEIDEDRNCYVYYGTFTGEELY
ncbi:hypothetical protein [Fredinandcohnia quinoae]|uniref:Uncharacterized protein n=1 Tax=Fredinandcohnia quinoae TaxID=2918902 RepID=A0AAW5DUH6_9BACI|nr:hypothetical protein [Fredinandcohnia sp. SECRCQ15]MCH1624287.1 hypothetical protein [Fredinandcohnia sp. SECRCQ15]